MISQQVLPFLERTPRDQKPLGLAAEIEAFRDFGEATRKLVTAGTSFYIFFWFRFQFTICRPLQFSLRLHPRTRQLIYKVVFLI